MLVPGSANPLLLRSAAAPAATGISRSIRLNAPDSGYLSRTPASAGNRKTWTWAGWVKRSKLGTAQIIYVAFSSVSNYSTIEFYGASDQIRIANVVGGVEKAARLTSQVFRDTSAWFHLVVASDSSTSLKVYVNGVEVTAFAVSTGPDTSDWSYNSTIAHDIGRYSGGYYADYYLADIYFIDGQALTPSSFTETDATTGQLIPKAYTGSYGTNGFRLEFADNSSNTATTLGKDTSGNGNNWTPNNLSINTGGPTSVAAASGALPIYNTTDTYGTTKGTGTRTDSNSSSIVLAIPMDGANNGTTFTDESATIKGSGSAKAITRYGDTKTVTSVSKYYGSSGFFDGTGDYLELAATSDFSFGSGNFTIECWLYANNTSNCDIFGYYSGSGFGFIVGNPYGTSPTAGTISIFDDRAGGDNLNAPGGTVTTSVWTHIAVVRNGSDLRIYKDGISVASKTTSATTFGDSTNAYGIGRLTGSFARNVNGYIQDFRIYKGVAKYTGNFNPPTSTVNATLAAGNDSLVDVPTNGSQTDTGVGGEVRGNYCTLNALDKGSSVTLTNGNLDISVGGTHNLAAGTIMISSGKYYAEFVAATLASGISCLVGVCNPLASRSSYLGGTNGGVGYGFAGDKWVDGSVTGGQTASAVGDVIGIALDKDNNEVKFYKNNTLILTQTGLNASQPYTFAMGHQNCSGTFNFGQRPFAYTAPSGFKALCTANLPAPLVTKPSTVMDVVTYTGTGAALTPTSTLGFNPDLVWIKGRSGATDHALYDSVRGVEKRLESNNTDFEVTSDGGVTAFNTAGFSVGTLAQVNTNAATYIGWCWDSGSSSVTNNAGTITSTVRANTTAGFSIVTYTGGAANSTVGHGLGVAPHLIIAKSRASGGYGSSSWDVYHRSLGKDKFLYLERTDAVGTYPNYWGSVEPTSTTFGVSELNFFNNRGDMVAYCFAPVVGYSSMGSFVSNGTADNSFVYTGFRPRFLIYKSSSVAGGWIVLDTSRAPSNVVGPYLETQNANAEGSVAQLDILSNGFKCRDSGFGSGTTYVYIAFAESPFNYARAR